MAIMLITHAMGVVAETAQRVVVMYAGRVVEEAPVERLFANPRHPYTQGLIRSIPRIDKAAAHKRTRLEAIPGVVPSLLDPPPGCRFAPRCRFAMPTCTRCGAGAARGRGRPQGGLRAVLSEADERAAAARQGAGEEFPGQGRRAARATVDQVHAVDRRQLRDRRRRDARAGRRIGLRQVDHRPLHPAADRADRGRDLVRGPQRHRVRSRRACARCAATCRSSSRIRTRRSIRA